MIDYKLEILSMVKAPEIESQTDVVTRVYWLLTGKDKAGGDTQEARGSVSLKPPAEDAAFTPFADLDKRTVMRWLADDPGIEAYKVKIAKALSAVDAPAPEIVAPPWQA